MPDPSLDELCELGQQQLMETQYLAAEATLVQAEQQALQSRNWDVLSRLYMPLQETRRQIRQTCGEGIVCLDLLAKGATDSLDPNQIVQKYPKGQLLLAGWGTIEPAIRLRQLARTRGLYLETFLAAAFPTTDAGRVVAIVPYDGARLPSRSPQTLSALSTQLPAGSLLLREAELPRGPRQGTFETYGQVMASWERLHAPFLAKADAEPDLEKKIELYRQTIRADSACELAHQNLSNAAKELARRALANFG